MHIQEIAHEQLCKEVQALTDQGATQYRCNQSGALVTSLHKTVIVDTGSSCGVLIDYGYEIV
jgi:hypothetical protein